jgi:hypothetical protein
MRSFSSYGQPSGCGGGFVVSVIVTEQAMRRMQSGNCVCTA